MKSVSIIIFLLTLLSLKAHAACNQGEIIRLSASGDTESYTKAKKALNDAESGDIIYLGSGEFNENSPDIKNKSNVTLTTECGATLRGSMTIRGSAFITISNINMISDSSNKSVIWMRGGNHANNTVVFDNLHISGGKEGIKIDEDNSNITIQNSFISNNQNEGVYFHREGGGPNFINLTRIHNNGMGVRIDEDRQVTLNANNINNNQGHGIFVESSASITPTDITLISNVFINNNGQIITGTSSRDLAQYPKYIDSSDSGNTTTSNDEGAGGSGNNPPIAVTGPDQVAVVGERVTLDGSDSYDIDGDSISYSWTLISAPTKSRLKNRKDNREEVRPEIFIDVAGDYVFELKVYDGKDYSETDTVRISTGNVRPVASAGDDQTVSTGVVAYLDAEDSYDPNSGDTLSYQWSFASRPSGSSATILNGNTALASFTPDLAGDYVLEVAVSDGSLTSKKDRVVVSTNNSAPKIVLGQDVISHKGESVTLDATLSSDIDSDDLIYDWKLISFPSGSAVDLEITDEETLTFSPDRDGLFVFQLTLDDGDKQSFATIVVDVQNQSPEAVITPSKSGGIVIGETLSLNASSSTDEDGDTLTYVWSLVSKPAGSAVTLASTSTSVSVTPDVKGDYTFKLVVSDSEMESEATYTFTSGLPPVAHAGSDLSKDKGQLFSLDGSGSSDPEGDDLSYRWSFVSHPVGSLATIGAFDRVNAQVIPDLPGTYSVQLVVSDGVFESAPDTATLIVTETINTPPTLDNPGNKTVKVGEKVKFKLTATDPENNPLKFMVGPFPLPEGFILDSMTGDVTYAPKEADKGTTKTLNFSVSDGTYSDQKTITITVEDIEPNGPTNLIGHVYDGTSTDNGLPLPVRGARVYIEGTDVESITDAEGRFALYNIPLGHNLFIIDASNADLAPDGKKYANFIEGVPLIRGVTNVEERPFYVPTITPGTQVVPGEQTTVYNADLDIYFDVAADNVKYPDGTPFEGELSVSYVPTNLAPVAMPSTIQPGTLLTVQPAGMRFDSPAQIDFPNSDNLPPGSILDIYSVDADLGIFVAVGKGQVTPDGKRIVTIEGGIRNATWHYVAPPPPEDNPEDEENDEDDCDNCNSDQPAQSRINISSGSYNSDHKLVTHRSLGVERFFNLQYSSATAFPTKVVDSSIIKRAATPTPRKYAVDLKINGLNVTERAYTDAESLQGQPDTIVYFKYFLEAKDMPTGVYHYSVETNSIYDNTSVGTISDEREMVIYNLRDSEFGVGWNLDNLMRLHVQTNGDVLLTMDSRTFEVYRKTETGYERPRFQQGKYALLSKAANGDFLRTHKDGMIERFNPEGLLISVMDRNRNETIYGYVNGTDNIEYIQDPVGFQTVFEYGADNLVKIIHHPGGRTTNLTHDSAGNLLSITYPDSSSEQFTYDERSLLTSKLDQNSVEALKAGEGVVSKVVNSYNNLGRITAQIKDGALYEVRSADEENVPVISAGIGTADNPLPLKTEKLSAAIWKARNGGTTIKYFDKNGLPLRVQDANGKVTTYQRDENSNVLTMVDSEGRRVVNTYDSKNNLLTTLRDTAADRVTYEYEPQFSQVIKVTDSKGTVTNMKRDERGNIVEIKTADGARNRLAYNNRGQVVSSTDAYGRMTQLRYNSENGNLSEIVDPVGNKTQMLYNEYGFVVDSVDAKGNHSLTEFDQLGRPVKSTDARGAETILTYDLKSNVTSLTDAQGGVTTFEFDSYDRVIKRIDPLGREEIFTYDSNGNVISKTNRNGLKIFYEYDLLDRLIKKTLPDGEVNHYTHDNTGNLIAASDNNVSYEFRFDSKNRKIEDKVLGGGILPESTLVSTFDNNDNRTSLYITEQNKTINYQFDKLNRLIQLDVDSNLVTKFEYNLNSDRTKIIHFNGIESEYSYDESSRLTKIAHVSPSTGTTLASFSYEFDENNNRSGMTTERLGLEGVTNSNLVYGYDSINQLVSATSTIIGDPNETFTFDLLGNRLRKTGDQVDATFDQNNKLLENSSSLFEYDLEGNLTKETDKTTLNYTEYVWNAENELVEIREFLAGKNDPYSVVKYTYGPLGRRIVKDINGEFVKYVYSDEDILEEYNTANELTSTFIHGVGIDEPLALQREEGSYIYQSDVLGSVTSIVDSGKNITQQYIYGSFGEVEVFDESSENIALGQLSINQPYGYTARELDAESDLYYYRARYYSPKTGRFISEDPIHFASGEINLYRYVLNNPLNFIDPNGRELTAMGAITAVCTAATIASILDFGAKLAIHNSLIQDIDDRIDELNEEVKTCPNDDRRRRIKAEMDALFAIKSKMELDLSELKESGQNAVAFGGTMAFCAVTSASKIL